MRIEPPNWMNVTGYLLPNALKTTCDPKIKYEINSSLKDCHKEIFLNPKRSGNVEFQSHLKTIMETRLIAATTTTALAKNEVSNGSISEA